MNDTDPIAFHSIHGPVFAAQIGDEFNACGVIRHRGIDFRQARRECPAVFSQPPKSMIAPAIHGQEIIDLVSAYPDGIRMSRLIETVAKRFGSLAVFHTSARLGLDLDGLLESFEARNKVRIIKGVVFPG